MVEPIVTALSVEICVLVCYIILCLLKVCMSTSTQGKDRAMTKELIIAVTVGLCLVGLLVFGLVEKPTNNNFNNAGDVLR